MSSITGAAAPLTSNRVWLFGCYSTIFYSRSNKVTLCPLTAGSSKQDPEVLFQTDGLQFSASQKYGNEGSGAVACSACRQHPMASPVLLRQRRAPATSSYCLRRRGLKTPLVNQGRGAAGSSGGFSQLCIRSDNEFQILGVSWASCSQEQSFDGCQSCFVLTGGSFQVCLQKERKETQSWNPVTEIMGGRVSLIH